MKKLIHVKKHLRKGKIVKAHSRKATKIKKTALAVKESKVPMFGSKVPSGMIHVATGRKNMKAATKKALFNDMDNSAFNPKRDTIHHKINRKKAGAILRKQQLRKKYS